MPCEKQAACSISGPMVLPVADRWRCEQRPSLILEANQHINSGAQLLTFLKICLAIIVPLLHRTPHGIIESVAQ